MAYVKIVPPVVHSQDDDGIWTTTVNFSDSTSTVYQGGYDIPVDRYIIQQAVSYLAVNQNLTQLEADSVFPSGISHD